MDDERIEEGSLLGLEDFRNRIGSQRVDGQSVNRLGRRRHGKPARERRHGGIDRGREAGGSMGLEELGIHLHDEDLQRTKDKGPAQKDQANTRGGL